MPNDHGDPKNRSVVDLRHFERLRGRLRTFVIRISLRSHETSLTFSEWIHPQFAHRMLTCSSDSCSTWPARDAFRTF